MSDMSNSFNLDARKAALNELAIELAVLDLKEPSFDYLLRVAHDEGLLPELLAKAGLPYVQCEQ